MLILLKWPSILKLVTMNNGGKCSSGCESGWTGYLERSWFSPTCSIHYYDGEGEDHDGVSGQMKIGMKGVGGGEEEEEEDMSMVSDASSGPPHFIDDASRFNFNNHHGCSFYPSSVVETNVADGSTSAALSERSRGRKKRNKDVKKQRMMLDDTASSRPVPHHMIKDGPPAIELFGHQYQQSQFLGAGNWMGFK